MEYLLNGLTLEVPSGCFPLSTDSMALAHFVRLPRDARVLDLGAGCGTLGLLLCAARSDCHVTGLELSPSAHDAATKNIRRNGLDHRMTSICGDLRVQTRQMPPGSFSCCVSNPPYFSGGPASLCLPDARREDQCSLAQLMEAAGRMLKYGGDFYLVHKPERLGQIIALAAPHHLETKRLCLVHHREDSPTSLILLQLRKGGKPGLILEEAALHHTDGTPTAYYNAVYHIQ